MGLGLYPKPNIPTTKLGPIPQLKPKPLLHLLHSSSSRLEVTLRWSSYRRRHQEALPPSATTGAAAHLVGAMHGEPHAGVGENQLATSRRGCCCWGGGAGNPLCTLLPGMASTHCQGVKASENLIPRWQNTKQMAVRVVTLMAVWMMVQVSGFPWRRREGKKKKINK